MSGDRARSDPLARPRDRTRMHTRSVSNPVRRRAKAEVDAANERIMDAPTLMATIARLFSHAAQTHDTVTQFTPETSDEEIYRTGYAIAQLDSLTARLRMTVRPGYRRRRAWTGMTVLKYEQQYLSTLADVERLLSETGDSHRRAEMNRQGEHSR